MGAAERHAARRAGCATNFFAAAPSQFRIFIDASCDLPADWRTHWAAPKQWGVTGNQHWATKYGAQGFIMISNSPFVTADWRQASASVVVLFARQFGGGPAIVQQQCLQRLRENSEAFRATNGSRHFFIFTDSRGPCCLDGKYKDVDFLRHHIIGPHGEPDPGGDGEEWFFRRGDGPRVRCFDARKDINIPTPNIHFPRTPFALPLPRIDAEPRSLLLFYAGWNYGVRMELVRMYERDPEVVVRRRVKRAEYAHYMRRSRYCPICGGFSQWTPRLAEALYHECVPVLLSPRMLPPWSSVLDWSLFSVRIEPTRANLLDLKAHLRRLDHAQLLQGVRAAKHALTYRLDGYRGDDMLPLLLFEMARVLKAAPIPPPAGVRAIANDVDPRRDYNAGLQDVRSQRKAHWVETHAAVAAGGAVWDCASMDGYMCECQQRRDRAVARRARRCFVSTACYDGPAGHRARRTANRSDARRLAALADAGEAARHVAQATGDQRQATRLADVARGGSVRSPAAAVCEASDIKTRKRQSTCRLPGVTAARAATAAPALLWSRESVRSRARFENEEPFNATRAFGRYWAQLPQTGSFSGSAAVRRHWAHPCDTPRCRSCAAVGASGTLLSHRHGALIDNHTVVLRANWLKIGGYEAHVGTRTTLNVLFALENMLDQFLRSQRKRPAGRRAIGLATPSSKRSLNSYLRYLGRLKANATHSLHRPKADDAPLYLLSDELWLHATAQLCAATRMGCEWYGRSSSMRPSSGFYAVLVALQICSTVSLFGLTSEPCAPFHYYGPAKKACTMAVPKENDEHVHWFEREHEIYRRWQREGRLRIYS